MPASVLVLYSSPLYIQALAFSAMREKSNFNLTLLGAFSFEYQRENSESDCLLVVMMIFCEFAFQFIISNFALPKFWNTSSSARNEIAMMNREFESWSLRECSFPSFSCPHFSMSENIEFGKYEFLYLKLINSAISNGLIRSRLSSWGLFYQF